MSKKSENVYLDNPIEVEKLPDEPLSFELLAETDDGEVWSPIAGVFMVVVIAVMVAHAVFIMNAHYVNGIRALLPFATVMVSLALAGWTMSRQEISQPGNAMSGLALAIVATVLVTAHGFGSLHAWLVAGALMFYSTGELAIHWSIVKKRGLDSRINPPEPEDPEAVKELDYAEMMVPAGFASFILVNATLIPAGLWVLVLVTLIVWAIAAEKCKLRKISPFALLTFAVKEAFLYPDHGATVPGLLRSPMLNRSARAIPAALFFACVAVLIIPAMASSVVHAVVFAPTAVGLLLGIWTLMASELTHEF